MRPEDVQNVVNLDANQLFQLIFELKGQKRIQDNHDKAQGKLKEVISLEQQTSKDLEDAQETLRKYEEKKLLFEENENKKRELQKLNLLHLKKQFWDSKSELEKNRRAITDEENKRDRLKNYKTQLQSELTLIQKSLNELSIKEAAISDQFDEAHKIVVCKSNKHTEIKRDNQQLANEISELEHILPEDIEALEDNLKSTDKELQQVIIECGIHEKRLAELQQQLKILNRGLSAYPKWVAQYKDALNEHSVPSVMLAESLSVRSGYEAWIEAIEAYLGRERYRIIVPKDYQLLVKQLQELHQYGARVSNPRHSRVKINNSILHGKYVTVRSALEVNNEDSIGGYLEHLNDIYLVGSVEEGHRLQTEGFRSLTQKGLLQDFDGAIFLKTKELVCGGISREEHKKQILNKMDDIEKQLLVIRSRQEELRFLKNELVLKIEFQLKRQQLPAKLVAKSELNEILDRVMRELNDANESYDILKKEQASVRNTITQVTGDRVRKNGEIDSTEKDIEIVLGSINGYKGNIGKCEIAMSSAVGDLKQLGFDDHAIEFIEEEILKENIFEREDGSEWSRELLIVTIGNLKNEIATFQHKDISFGIIAMVEPQKGIVAQLIENLRLAKADREEWENRLAIAELALRNHVQETMSQYIEEFKSMAELLGAEADGKFLQEGPNYLQWQVRIKIGFDSKELVLYDDPEFSSGQRAALSIMLLLAAISNKKEGSRNNIMFLDEPTARVDDARANEIGMILQKTNIQYFITHQVSESLKSVDWIDHALITSKLRSRQSFADDPIFETRRRGD